MKATPSERLERLEEAHLLGLPVEMLEGLPWLLKDRKHETKDCDPK